MINSASNTEALLITLCINIQYVTVPASFKDRSAFVRGILSSSYKPCDLNIKYLPEML